MCIPAGRQPNSSRFSRAFRVPPACNADSGTISRAFFLHGNQLYNTGVAVAERNVGPIAYVQVHRSHERINRCVRSERGMQECPWQHNHGGGCQDSVHWPILISFANRVASPVFTAA
jgi:hypothetical protein